MFYVLTQSNLIYVIEIELKFKNDTNTSYISIYTGSIYYYRLQFYFYFNIIYPGLNAK